MEIIGGGFLAQSLKPIAERHPDATVLAAGVSSTSVISPKAFLREATLLGELLDKCAVSGRRIVFLSTATSGMYSGLDGAGREDAPVSPVTSYARHKLALEQAITASGVDHLVLRLTHTVGAHQRAHQLLPSLVRQIRSGHVTIYRGASRDLIDIVDVVRIIDALLAADVSRTVVNVASGYAVPAGDIVDHIERRLGVVAEKDYVDQPDGRPVAIDKLIRLAPITRTMGFGRDYFRKVIDRHLPLVLSMPTAIAHDHRQEGNRD
jgi:nucleoside-diphosphate-sugar epimerase